MDRAYSFPPALLESSREESLENADDRALATAIEKDTGYRISEGCGLVWGDYKKSMVRRGPCTS